MLNIVSMIKCLGYLILLANKAYGCWDKYTDWNNAGNGNTVFLDRQRLNCGGSGNVLNMFKLERSGSDPNQIRYKYKCCKHTGSSCSIRKVNNRFTVDGGGEVIYLDRQRVACNSNGLVNDFKLSRNGAHNKYRYEYYCCDLNRSRLSCHDSSTSFTDEGNRTNFYLDRQTVACSNGNFLQSFRLKRNSPANNRIRYDITCCRVNY